MYYRMFTFQDVSLFPIMRLFLPAADRERGPHGLKEKSLADLFVRILCLGKNSSDGQKLLKYKYAKNITYFFPNANFFLHIFYSLILNI